MNTPIENIETVEVNRFQLNVSFSPTKRKPPTKKKEVPLRKFLLKKIHKKKKQQVGNFFACLRLLWSMADPKDDFQVLKLYLHAAIVLEDTFHFNSFGFNFKPNKRTTSLLDYIEGDTWRSSLQENYTQTIRDREFVYVVGFHRRNKNSVLVTIWDAINGQANYDVFEINHLKYLGRTSCRYDDKRTHFYLQIVDLISLKNMTPLEQPQS